MLQAQEQWQGVNPFKMGVVASSDSHTGVMGWHPETEDWPGHLGIDDAWPMERPSTIQNSSGGHSVVWAEENSRDSIFEALKRKETYGTSGTRPIVRFFGGWNFAKNLCRTNFVPTGYAKGVPMGGDLPAGPAGSVAALHRRRLEGRLHRHQPGADPDHQGLGDGADGEKKEKVYHVVGDRGNPQNPGGRRSTGTCETKPGGFERLCQVWTDPDFNPNEPAFYYVRVLEKPVCRYSTLWCRERIGVDPLDLNQCQRDLDRMASSNDPAPAGERGARRLVLQQPDDLPLRAAGDPGARLDVADLVQPSAVSLLRAPALHMVAHRGAALRGRAALEADSTAPGSGPGS